MIDERLESLLNEELDGVLSPEAEGELRGRLERDPEARVHRDRLRHLVRTLDAAGEAEPPPGLRERILDLVAARGSRGTAVRPASAPDSRRGFRPRWSPGLAYSFAAGLAVGCLAFAILRAGGPPVDRDHLTGAMVETAEGVLDHTEVSVGGIEGTVTVLRESGRILAEVVLRGEAETVVKLGVGGASWDVSHTGASRYRVDLGPAERFPGEVALSVQVGGASMSKLLSTARAK